MFTKYSGMNGIIRGSIVFAICNLTPTHKDYFKKYHFTSPMFRSVNVNHYLWLYILWCMQKVEVGRQSQHLGTRLQYAPDS